MAVLVTTTPEDVAVDLGRDPAGLESIERAQLQRWIDDAALLISKRLGETIVPASADLDYVIRQAVVAVASAPVPGVQSESVQVDDGMLTTRFNRAPRRVSILPEWWALLGLTDGGGKAFSVSMIPAEYSVHALWCDVNFGGGTCSCGASIAGYPIYEP